MPYTDWLDPDEYPDDDDIETFGDDSPTDNDPLTIGNVPGVSGSFWTAGRVIFAVVALLLILLLALPLLR